MDLFGALIFLQAVPTTGSPQIPGDLADGGLGAVFSRTVTDLLNRAWGKGDKDRHAPGVILLVCAIVAGIIGVALMMIMKGIDITDIRNLATAIFQGTTQAGPLAIAGTEISKDAREPSKVNAAVPVETAPGAVVTVVETPTPDAPPTPAAPPSNGPTSPSNGADAPTPPPVRDRIIAAAESRLGMPYQLDPPPDGVNTIDCSLFVLKTYEDAGVAFSGVRTAEQIRQACQPIPFSAVKPGDLLFFEHTYEPTEPAGPDGRTASHIGISYGAGTLRMIDAHGAGVQLTDIGGDYWQTHMLEARRAPQLGEDVPMAPQPSPTGTVRGIDVASYQPADLTDLIRQSGAQHVVVRMYQRSVEGEKLQAHSRQQVASAVANGCTVTTPYMWLYASVDPAQQINEAIDLAEECGIALKLLFIDVEPYTDGSLPTADQVRAALAACEARGVRGAIYSGAWVWPRLGNPSLPGVPLWTAIYDENPTLDVKPFGDMTIVGHQYSDKLPNGQALDCDVFDSSVI